MLTFVKKSQLTAKKSFAQNLAKRGLLWSYDASQVDTLPDTVLIEHGFVYGDVPDIQAIFEIFPLKIIKKIWKTVLLPNPNHRKLNYYLAIFFFHYKNPKRVINKKYETRLDRLQRLAS